MSLESTLAGYGQYLQLEKSLSKNSVSAYFQDVDKLLLYLNVEHSGISLQEIELSHLEKFSRFLGELGLAERTQLRIHSGIKNFFNYLHEEAIIKENCAVLWDGPKQGSYLPTVLEISEIDKMISCIDLSKPFGERDKAIVEVLFGSGLRVSELIGLSRSDVLLEDSLLVVTGKGNKQRLVPMTATSKKQILFYLEKTRNHQTSSENKLFLNHRGAGLSRVHIFKLVKKLASRAGIRKNVSPHTLRHSFASALVDAGADLRAIQQLLGHKSITTTEIYAHLDRSFLAETLKSFHPRS